MEKLHRCKNVNIDNYLDQFEYIRYDSEHKEWLLILRGYSSYEDCDTETEQNINYCPFCGEKLEVK
jgi:hypothetical protein